MPPLSPINRTKELFTEDISKHETQLSETVNASRFLVIGGAGSIEQVVTRGIFKRNPQKLHVVDISENHKNGIFVLVKSGWQWIMANQT